MKQRNFRDFLNNLKLEIDNFLTFEIRKLDFSDITKHAIEKSVAVGGKRVRAIMTYVISRILGISRKDAIRLACCVEFSHAFTLVHDDMIDKPAERRGNPPLFSEFGENLALLIGDMLFAMSFSYLKIEPFYFANFLEKVIEGQILDVLWLEGKIERSEDTIQKIQQLKTSSLFKISSVLPVLYLKNGNERGKSVKKKIEKIWRTLELFGHHFGFAFQILDDMKDIEEDKAKGNPNIVDFLGLDRALELFYKHKSLAIRYLDQFILSIKTRTFFCELLKYLCIEVLNEKDIQSSSTYKGN